MKRTRFLPDEAATIRLAEALSRCLKPPAVVHLCGPLGAGKTSLVRALLRAWGFDGPVRSPTYTLVEPYDFPWGVVYHVDWYRLRDPLEIENLGLRDQLDARSLCLIEWPERGGALTPPADWRLTLAYAAGGGRELAVEGPEEALRDLEVNS